MSKIIVSCIFCVVVFALESFAAEYPAPTDGIVTLTDGMYEGSFPEGTTKLVVNVGTAEKVVISGDNSGFTGVTEILGGTLLVKSRYALGGESATVSVKDGGRLELSFAQPDGATEETTVWMPHTIIKGTGSNGNGVFKASFIGTKMCDNGVRSLELSGDATVDLSVDSVGDQKGKRWGVKNLNLNGCTITRVNADVDFVMKKNTIKPGHFVNNAGVLLFQESFFENCTAENVSFTINGGLFRAWNNPSNKKIPGPIFLLGGALDFQTSTSASYFSAPVKFSSGSGITSTSASYAKKVAHFQCGLENVSATDNFSVKSYGTNYISKLSSLSGCKGFDFSVGVSFVTGAVSVAAGGVNAMGGNVVFAGDVNRTIGGGVKAASGGIWSQSAGITDTSMLRIDNGYTGYGTFRLSGGSFSTRTDTPYCGETQSGLGVFVQEGGEFICSNTFNLAKRPGGFGMVVQKGGMFELRRPNSDYGNITVGQSGDGRYYQLGGTNISRNAFNDNAQPRTYLGSTNGLCQMVVSGTGTVYVTGRLVAGNSLVPSTNVVAVVNGGTLKAARVMGMSASVAPGTVSSLIVDGGTISPSYSFGFSGLNPGDTFFNRNFTYAIAGERGVTIDTSECFNGNGIGYECLFPHVFSAPSGCGISSIALPESVKGLAYRGPVPIVIEGKGYGAAAFADFDYARMCISTAVVLSAGCDYDENTKVYVLEAKATGAPVRHECSFVLTSATRTAGPLTKRGAQRLTLYGVQGWGVETIIESGELKAVDKGSVPDGLKLTVLNGATLNLNTNDLSVTVLAGVGTITAEKEGRGNVTLASGGTIEADAADMVAGKYLELDKGMLIVAGTAKIKVLDPDSRLSRSGKFSVLSAAKGITIAEGALISIDPDSDLDGEWRILNKAGRLTLYPAKGFVFSFR